MAQKKIASTMMILLMTLALVSCGGKSQASSVSAGTEAGTSAPQSSPNKGQAMAPAETAEAKFTGQAGWNFSRYGGWIENKWDSDMFPVSSPAMPEGTLADQTYYKGADDESMSSDQAGRLYFSDSRFELWQVSFFCEQEQLDALFADIESKGFAGGKISGYNPAYDFSGNGYYLYLETRDNYSSNDYTYSCLMIIAKPTFPVPKTFQGTKLPQVGIILQDFTNPESYTSIAYDTEYNEVEWIYDFIEDKGDLPYHFDIWYNYVGTTSEDAKNWAHDLVAAGWKLRYEYDDDNGYRAAGEKDGIFFKCSYIDYDSLLEIGFASMMESLDY